jgi:ankyrin repeat protein
MRYFAAVAIAVLTTGCLSLHPPRLSPLAGPARHGDLATLQRLLAAGADPNMVDPGGNRWSPLLHAVHKRQLAAVDLLLRSGADPKRPAGNVEPLLMAVGTGDANMVRRLLAAGADPRSDPDIIVTAVSGGALSDLENPLLGQCNTEVVKALQQRAPGLRVPNGPRGHLAMMFARWNNCAEVVRLAGR